MNLISGEKLQELADLTIIFSDQRHDELWKVQIHNINCEYVIGKSPHNFSTKVIYCHNCGTEKEVGRL